MHLKGQWCIFLKRIFISIRFLILLACGPVLATNTYPYLIFDLNDNQSEFPKNFRSAPTPYPKDAKNTPSRLGLDTLNISGSGQFTETNFKQMVTRLKIKTGYIIDLRQESHGFLDSTPVSWFGVDNSENKGKTPKKIRILENRLIQNLKDKKKVTVFHRIKEEPKVLFKPELFSYQSVSLEKTFVTQQGFKYIRYYVLDHFPPTDAQIDEFVQFVKKLPPSTWLHFHCHAGDGRTTTFMVLYDMIRNAHNVSMMDIIKRQTIIGGANLMDISHDSWRITLKQQRLHLIEAFYLYAKDPKGYPAITWSEWRRGQIQKTSHKQ